MLLPAPRSARGFAAAWIVLPTAAGIATVPLVANTPADAQLLVLGVAGTLAVALPQWLVLRDRLVRAAWWVAATVGGTALGLAANLLSTAVVWAIAVPGDPADPAFWAGPAPPAALAVGLTACGMGPAFAQWLLLRRRVRRAAVWLATGAVFSLAGAIHQATSPPPVWPPPSWTEATFECLVGGLIYGAVTAPVLLWLLRPPDGDLSRATSPASPDRRQP